jgi:hypothetical protein
LTRNEKKNWMYYLNAFWKNISFRVKLYLISTHFEKKLKLRWSSPRFNAVWIFFFKLRCSCSKFNALWNFFSKYLIFSKWVVTVLEWMVIYATVTQSRFRTGSIRNVNRIDPVPPVFTKDPHRNMCQFLRIPGATIRRRKHFCHVQNFCASKTV